MILVALLWPAVGLAVLSKRIEEGGLIDPWIILTWPFHVIRDWLN